MQYLVLKAKLKRRLRQLLQAIPAILLFAGLFVGIHLVVEQKLLRKQAAPALPSGGICPMEGASCEWRAPKDSRGSGSAVSFFYEITDLTTGQTVKSGTTSDTKITFTPDPDHTYSCKVETRNACGQGPAQTALKTCEARQPTPSLLPPPSLSASPTPTPTPSPTVSSTPGPSPTAGPSPTLQPSPTPTPTLSATIGPTVSPAASPTATPTATPAVSHTAAPTTTPATSSTPTPTPLAPQLPESGVGQATLYVALMSLMLTLVGVRLLF